MISDHVTGILIKLAVSLVIGMILGTEREYRNKSAGIRTIMLICLGSTIFTIISLEVSHPSEIGRIASNIVTGIGFLGAGAIMRDGLSVSGLTTASTVWVSAALGMAVGYGEFELAIAATLVTIAVLVLFTYQQKLLDKFHRTMTLCVSFEIDHDTIKSVEQKMQELNVSYIKKRQSRKGGEVTYNYEIAGRDSKVESLIDFLISQREKIKSFSY